MLTVFSILSSIESLSRLLGHTLWHALRMAFMWPNFAAVPALKSTKHAFAALFLLMGMLYSTANLVLHQTPNGDFMGRLLPGGGTMLQWLLILAMHLIAIGFGYAIFRGKHAERRFAIWFGLHAATDTMGAVLLTMGPLTPIVRTAMSALVLVSLIVNLLVLKLYEMLELQNAIKPSQVNTKPDGIRRLHRHGRGAQSDCTRDGTSDGAPASVLRDKSDGDPHA